jgi:DNA polymerase/3'-5' exonuclease PolX
MQLDQATAIAERIKAQLAPHCDRIEIAGSIRRRKADVGDIEIVAIPKPYDVGLFASGIAPIVSAWPKVRGELPCTYTQRTLPDGIALDLFFATAENWGLIFAIRTGSADYSHRVLACGWVRNGYKSADGMLTRDGATVPVREERDLFRLAGVQWVEPEARRLHSPNAPQQGRRSRTLTAVVGASGSPNPGGEKS